MCTCDLQAHTRRKWLAFELKNFIFHHIRIIDLHNYIIWHQAVFCISKVTTHHVYLVILSSLFRYKHLTLLHACISETIRKLNRIRILSRMCILYMHNILSTCGFIFLVIGNNSYFLLVLLEIINIRIEEGPASANFRCIFVSFIRSQVWGR